MERENCWGHWSFDIWNTWSFSLAKLNFFLSQFWYMGKSRVSITTFGNKVASKQHLWWNLPTLSTSFLVRRSLFCVCDPKFQYPVMVNCFNFLLCRCVCTKAFETNSGINTMHFYYFDINHNYEDHTNVT